MPERRRTALQSPAPVLAPPPGHPARWAETLPGPGRCGLVVAALIGGTAAGSWALTAALAYQEIERHERRAAVAELAPAVAQGAPRDACAVATAEFAQISERRNDRFGL